MRALTAAVLLSASALAMADDFDFNVVAQPDFNNIAADLTGSLGYKALGPAEAGGITGFSVGAYAAYAPTESPQSWRNATGSDVDATGVVGLAASKGLPFNFDIGASYAEVPGTEANLTGVEIRYALLEGSTVSPALALRASYTKLGGVDDFDFKSRGIDVSISKGFLVATPYAGVGRIESKLTPKGSFAAINPALREAETKETRLFAGVRLAFLPLIAITPEFERVGDVSSYNLRLGVSF